MSKAGIAAVAGFVLCVCTGPAIAADNAPARAQSESPAWDAAFGGPGSTSAQIRSDQEAKKAIISFEQMVRAMQPYYDFKERIKKEHGLAFGMDYNMLYQHAGESPGKQNAAGGVLRFYGTWTLAGEESGNRGVLVFKVEDRHRLGTEIAPKSLGGEIGYAGVTAPTFSDAGSVLTNLYWGQLLFENRLGFFAGIVDAADYVDVYGLANVWTDFNNLAFSTNPTIPVPSQGMGGAVRWSFPGNYYAHAGLADANGDPSRTSDSADSFFNDREYFKHAEIGWYGSWESRIADNIHLTAWHADERTNARVPSGSGAAFSFSRKINERWLPFLRIGYANGSGAILERSVSTGFGYYPSANGDVFGLGLNWGRPNPDIFGSGKPDQYTAEAYYRVQLFRHLAITPDLQVLINPPNYPDRDAVWVLSVRARFSF